MATSEALIVETPSVVIPSDHFESLPSAACNFKSESNGDVLCLDVNSHVESREGNEVDAVDLFLNPTNGFIPTLTSTVTHGETLRTSSLTESNPYLATQPFSEFVLPSSAVDQAQDQDDAPMEASETRRDFNFSSNSNSNLGDPDLAQLLQGHTGELAEDFDSILNDFNLAELIRESDGVELSSSLADPTSSGSGFGSQDPQADVSRELDAARARLAELEAVFKLQQTQSSGNGHYLPRHHPYAQVQAQQAQADGRVNIGLLLELASVHQQQRLQHQQQNGNNQSVLALLESLLARRELASSLGIDSNNATVKLLALVLHAQLAQQQRQNHSTENIFSNLARRQSFDASSLRRASLSTPAEFTLPHPHPQQIPAHPPQGGLFTPTMPGFQGLNQLRRFSCPEARDMTMFAETTNGYPWQRGPTLLGTQVASDEEGCLAGGLGADENKSNLKLFVQTIGRYTKKEREARIERYRLKRQQRCFSKKIRYQCRKQLADSRPRFKGRFCKIPESESPEFLSSPYQQQHPDDDETKVPIGHTNNHKSSNAKSTTAAKGRAKRRESISHPTSELSPSTDTNLVVSCDAIISPLTSASSSLTSSPSLNEMHDMIPTPKKLNNSPINSRARASPSRNSAQPQRL